jgi:hypothetical protein
VRRLSIPARHCLKIGSIQPSEPLEMQSWQIFGVRLFDASAYFF